MKQVTDTGAIEKVIDEVIAANPDKVEQAKAKPTLLGWFVGQVMKASAARPIRVRSTSHPEGQARDRVRGAPAPVRAGAGQHLMAGLWTQNIERDPRYRGAAEVLEAAGYAIAISDGSSRSRTRERRSPALPCPQGAAGLRERHRRRRTAPAGEAECADPQRAGIRRASAAPRGAGQRSPACRERARARPRQAEGAVPGARHRARCLEGAGADPGNGRSGGALRQ